MLPDERIRCPYTGFKRTCRGIVTKHTCPKFIKIVGTNANTGETIDQWGCADSFVHLLLIENSQMQRQTGAAIESFRNEMVRQNNELLSDQRRSNGAETQRI